MLSEIKLLDKRQTGKSVRGLEGKVRGRLHAAYHKEMKDVIKHAVTIDCDGYEKILTTTYRSIMIKEFRMLSQFYDKYFESGGFVPGNIGYLYLTVDVPAPVYSTDIPVWDAVMKKVVVGSPRPVDGSYKKILWDIAVQWSYGNAGERLNSLWSPERMLIKV